MYELADRSRAVQLAGLIVLFYQMERRTDAGMDWLWQLYQAAGRRSVPAGVFQHIGRSARTGGFQTAYTGNR